MTKDAEQTRAGLLSEVRKLRRRVLELEKIEEDLRRVQKALAESKERQRSLSELVSDRVFRVIPDARGQMSIEWLLGNVGSITGHSAIEAADTSQWKKIVHQDDWSKVGSFVKTVLSGRKSEVELRVTTKAGDIRWMRVYGRPEWDDGKRRVRSMLCSATEITESKRIEAESLRRSEQFRTWVENILDSFGIFTAVRDESGDIVDFRIDYVNPAAVADSPLRREDIMGKGSLRKLLGVAGKEFFDKCRDVVETGRPMLRETLVYDDVCEGKPRTRLFDVSAARLGDGLSGLWRDVTDRKLAEQETRSANERLEYLLSATPAVIYTAQPFSDYGATFVSGNVTQVTGYEPREFVENPSFWVEHLHPDDVERVMSEAPRVLKAGRYTYEYRFKCKDGRYIWMNDDMKLVLDEAGDPLEIVGYWTDVTERRHTEQELIRLERLRALGQMAAGVSHNLNNMLTTILGPAKLLQRNIDDPGLLRETEFILTSARRAKDLVRRLNEAVRGGADTGLGPVAANRVVKEAVEMTRPIWKDEAEGKNIVIEVDTDLNHVSPIRGTHSGLLDIVINLLLNAVDALPGGGKISIRTRAADGGVELTVSDNGVGMDESTRGRIFEPFFSTKTELGTGLGLSTVYGTVSRWGGDIDVDSTLGEGATFTIRLPTWAGTESKGPLEEGVIGSRPARILIVEDVEAICSMLLRLLSEDHDVDTVLSGREALEKFSPGRYDVAIIDLGLSGITGDRVGRLMRQSDPAIATVLISGWELREDDPRVAPFDFWLEKPFDDLKHVEAVLARAIELHESRSRGSSSDG